MTNHASVRISVVVPAFNPGERLMQALGSCLAQTTLPHEVIVVDDGGTDHAVERAADWWRRQHTSLPLRVIRQDNGGPATARNRGWDAATGDLVAFLDADDVWLPEKLAVVSAAWPADAVGIGHRHRLPGDGMAAVTGRTERLSLLYVVARNPFTTPSLVVRRQLPLRFDPTFRYAEDHELIARLAATGPLYCLDAILVELHRAPLTPGGLSSDRTAMRLGELRMYARLGRLRWWLAPLVPGFLALSIGKHLLGAVRRQGRAS